jgi:hypothetical protein
VVALCDEFCDELSLVLLELSPSQAVVTINKELKNTSICNDFSKLIGIIKHWCIRLQEMIFKGATKLNLSRVRTVKKNIKLH